MKKRKIAVHTEEIPCAFCKGTGKDPFDLLSPLSTCQVCSGTGTRVLPTPLHRCAYCRGTGVHPHSRMICMTCRGAGQVTIPENAIVCPGCNGSGREADHHFQDSVLSCMICGGKGVIAADSEAAKTLLAER
jgi:DnaJ-class molecular chaperone